MEPERQIWRWVCATCVKVGQVYIENDQAWARHDPGELARQDHFRVSPGCPASIFQVEQVYEQTPSPPTAVFDGGDPQQTRDGIAETEQETSEQ